MENLHRFDADNNGETSCVVFAESFERCKSSLESFGVRILYQYPFINAFGITVKVHEREELKSLSSVRQVLSQTKVVACMDKSSAAIFPKMPQRSFFGRDIGVAVLDTGIAPHLDFLMPFDRIVAFKDFIGNEIDSYDDNGHGTFVAGVIAGNGLTGGGRLKGIAPEAQLISLKCMDKSGEAGAFKILQAMQWVFDNAEEFNIRVACMSFGSEPLAGDDPLCIGAEILWQKGIVVVAAAGNSGPAAGTIKSPGISSKIITVGGADTGVKPFRVADFSSRGAEGSNKPDLVAPSVNIHGAAVEGEYTHMSGTSVAAPMVAGLIATIIEEHPKWTPDKIKSELLIGAQKLKDIPQNVGHGFAVLPINAEG